MAETLRELVVSLSLSSDNFDRNIKSVNQRIREAESNFQLAAAGVDGFSGTFKGASAGVDTLKKKLELQNSTVDQFEKKLKAANETLEKAKAKVTEQAAKLDGSKQSHAALTAEIAKAEAAHKASARSTGDNSEQTVRLGVAVLELKEKEKALNAEIKDGEAKLKQATSTVQRNEDAVSKAQTGLNRAKGAVKETTSALDKLTGGLGKAGAVFGVLATKAIAAGESMERTGKYMSTRVTAPLAALGAFAFKAAVDFESAFAGVRKTVNATEAEFAQLEQSVKDMSLEVPSTTTVIAGVMEAAGQLGIANENLEEYTRTMIDLGNSTNLAATEAATGIAQFSNITGMAQGDAGKFGSALVDLGNNFATTERDVMNMATRLAGAGAQVGLSEAQILGFATALSSVGIEAEAGGSAFSKVMTNMEVAVATGKNGLEDFAKVSGMTNEQFISAWKTEPAKAIESFIVGLSKMDEEGISAIATLDEMGISEVRLRDTLLRATNATELFANAQTTAASAWAEGTALTAEAEQRYGTVASQLQILKNRVSLAAQSLGTEMVPMAKRVIEAVSGLIDRFMALSTHQKEQIVKWGAIAAAVGPALIVFGKITGGAGKTIQAILGITRAMKGLSLVQWGWTGVAIAGIAGLAAAFIYASKHGDELERKWNQIRGQADEKNIAEMSAKINVNATVEGFEDAQTRVQEIKDWLNGLAADGLLTQEEVDNVTEALEGDYAPIVAALISVGVPPDVAENVHKQVKGAQQQARNALLLIKPSLSETEVEALVALVGKPAEEVAKGLLEFGFEEGSEEYQAMLDAILEANRLVDEAYGEVKGVDPETLKTIKEKTGDDRAALMAALMSLGISEADAYRIGLEIMSPTKTISAATKLMYKDVIDTLTDGLPDDPATIAALKQRVGEKFQTLVGAVDEQARAEIAKLDPTDPEYQTKVEAILLKAAEVKAALEGYEQDYSTFIDTYAGKHADVVRQHAEELLKLTGDVDAVLEYIRQAEAEVRDAGKTAFDMTRKGQTLDKDTITKGINYSIAKKNTGVADAETQYKKDIADLQARLQAGEISDKIYLIEEGLLQQRLTEEKERIVQEYEQALLEMADGIAKASGNANWGDEFAQNIEARDVVGELMKSINKAVEDGDTEFELDLGDEAIQNALKRAFGEDFDVEGVLGDTAIETVLGYLTDAFNTLDGAVTDAVNADDTPPALTEYVESLLSSGALDGIDTSDTEAKLRLMAGVVGGALPEGLALGMENKEDAATDAAKGLSQKIIDEFKIHAGVRSPSREFAKLGGYLVDGLVQGVRNSTWKIRLAMIAMAQEAIKAAKNALGIASPSAIFRDEIGKMMVRGVGVGVEAETEAQRRTIANAARAMTASARDGVRAEMVRTSNDNRNQSVTVKIENFSGATKQDIEALAQRIGALQRRAARGVGY